MKKRNFGVVAGAMALAGLMGFGQTAQGIAVKTGKEIQAANTRNQRRVRLPFVSPVGSGNPYVYKEPGLSPTEYGMRFGTGKSRIKKSNRLAFSTKAKLKRRFAA